MDLVKNRMQVSGEGGAARLYNNSIHCASTIIKNEGVLGLYNGLSVRDLRTIITFKQRSGRLIPKYSIIGSPVVIYHCPPWRLSSPARKIFRRWSNSQFLCQGWDGPYGWSHRKSFQNLHNLPGSRRQLDRL